MRALSIVLLLLSAATAGASGRQLPMLDFVQEVWDAKEGGLPHPGVTVLLQTRDGYLWVGTFTGLARFDGHDFVSYTDTPALSDHIRSLHEMPDGSLWVGTRRSGALHLRDGRVVETLTQKEGLPSKDVIQLASTPDGTLWILAGGVVARASDGTMRRYEEGLPAGALYALLIDPDGTVWVSGANASVAWLDGARFRPLRWESLPEGTPGRVNDLGRDAAGALWAATGSGVFRFAGEKTAAVAWEKRLPNPAASLSLGKRGVWSGGERGLELAAGSEVRRYTTAEGLLHNTVQSMLEDSEGNFWIGTRTGLARLRPRLVYTYTQKDGLPAEHVTAVLETQAGELWVGTENGLAVQRDGQWTSFGAADGLPGAAVRALGEGPDGTVWVGTVQGLARRAGGRFSEVRIENTPTMVRSIAVDVKGHVLVGTHGSAHVYQIDRSGTVTTLASRPQLCNTGPIVLAPTVDGGLWVGGAAALAFFKDGQTRCDTDSELASRNDVREVLIDGDTLWLGTIAGLARIDGSARRSLAWRGGPLRTAVYSILDDGLGSFWLGTPKGLFQIARAELHAETPGVAYRSYGIEDGMATGVATGDGDPSAIKARDGRLYFATAAGLAVVDPRRIERSAVPPPVHVERLAVDQRPMDLKSGLRLAPGTRDVQLDFVALSFIAPERVEYKYKLEGYDNDWMAAGARRSAYYTNLPPGAYRFRVRAANQDGVWNEEGAALPFELLPRVYQRRWFTPLVAALLAGMAVAFYRRHTASLRAREIELRRAVDEAVANIQVLHGLLPICASCKKVREDGGYWRQIEAYVMSRSSATFSHSICPECYEQMRRTDPNLPSFEQLR